MKYHAVTPTLRISSTNLKGILKKIILRGPGNITIRISLENYIRHFLDTE